MLVEDFSGALDGEVADLGGFVGEIDGAGGEPQVEGNRLALEVEQSDEHGGAPLWAVGLFYVMLRRELRSRVVDNFPELRSGGPSASLGMTGGGGCDDTGAFGARRGGY